MITQPLNPISPSPLNQPQTVQQNPDPVIFAKCFAEYQLHVDSYDKNPGVPLMSDPTQAPPYEEWSQKANAYSQGMRNALQQPQSVPRPYGLKSTREE